MKAGFARPLAIVAAVLALLLIFPATAYAQNAVNPLQISVFNVTTGQDVPSGAVITQGDVFHVTVTLMPGVNCAGQYVVTAIGVAPAPPSAMVQSMAFILGPAVGSSSVTGGDLDAGTLPNGKNDYKVSASCNAAPRNAIGFARFEFFVKTP